MLISYSSSGSLVLMVHWFEWFIGLDGSLIGLDGLSGSVHSSVECSLVT